MKYLLDYTVLLLLIFITVGPATADLADDLVIYFTFDNVKGKRVIDESGNGLDAKVIENTKFAKGKYGDAIHITRETEDCVNVSADDELEIGEAITMMAWVYHEDWTGQSSHWFDKGTYSEDFNSTYGMTVYNENDAGGGGWLDNGSAIGLILGGEHQVRIIIQNSMENKTWHHIVGTCEGTSVKIYLDGEILVETETPFEFRGINNQDLRIGCAKGKPEYAFEDGLIDEVAIWSRALREGEIKQAMAGNFLAVSPSDKAITTWADVKKRLIAP